MNYTLVDQFQNIGTGRNSFVDYEAAIERMIRRKLMEMSINRFKWLNLPDSVDPRFLETTLYGLGLSVFYYDFNYSKFLSLKGAPTGVLDYQDNPTQFMVTGNAFVSQTLSASDCVPIWANYTRSPDHDIVTVYARRLAKLDRTIEINSDNARQPRVLVVDEDTRLGVENINRQIDQGVPTVRVRQDIAGIVTSLDMGTDPRIFDLLGVARSRVWNECMSLLGINNANQDKKERLVADEVAANDEQVEIVKQTNLAARKLACKQINKRFGLNIDVEYDSDIERQYASVNTYDEELRREFASIVGGEA